MRKNLHADPRLSAMDIRAKLNALDWPDHGIAELVKLIPRDTEGCYVLMLHLSGYIIAHGHTLSAAELQALRAHAALVKGGMQHRQRDDATTRPR